MKRSETVQNGLKRSELKKGKTKSPVKSTFTRLFFDSERGIRTLDDISKTFDFTAFSKRYFYSDHILTTNFHLNIHESYPLF